jgi:hypothetical protein
VSKGRKTDACKDRAIAALVAGESVEAAAAAAKINRRTLSLWMYGNADFQARYAAARKKLLDDALLLLQRSARHGVIALLKAVAGDDPALSVKASVALLEQTLRIDSYVSLEGRVAALEEDRKRDAEPEQDRGESGEIRDRQSRKNGRAT